MDVRDDCEEILSAEAFAVENALEEVMLSWVPAKWFVCHVR